MSPFNATVNPVLIEITRGPAVESRHRGAIAVADGKGNITAFWGDIETPIYPRSAIKPLQAIPLIETGAAGEFSLTSAEIALACASHTGTADHVAKIAGWLEKIGERPDSLVCGAVVPADSEAAEVLIRAGEKPGPLHNNCSGKHTGFVTTAAHLGETAATYAELEHPVQGRVLAVLEDLGGIDLADAAVGIDGCGVPNFAMPLTALARAMARLANPETLAGGRRAAAAQIFAAMTANPQLIRGPGFFDTEAIEAGRGAFAVKGGAEGVATAIIPELGLGVALKIDDGARRAADAAMIHLLKYLGALDDGMERSLAAFLDAPTFNAAGKRVGGIRPCDGWPDR